MTRINVVQASHNDASGNTVEKSERMKTREDSLDKNIVYILTQWTQPTDRLCCTRALGVNAR